MDGRYIVPVEPASAAADLVVIEVRQNGNRPLDVQLVGCEGESPYVVNIRHQDVGALKHKFKGTDKEWEAILCHFLLQHHPEPEHTSILDNVRLIYTLNKDDLLISFRQDVKGIKVTLGEITLPKDDEFEFNPFEWAQSSAEAHNRTLKELAHFKARATGEQATIAKLQAQLDDFIKTKGEIEKEMLQQFMVLLNEKKRKIRDQNRLLAGAKVDASTASTVKASREETKPRKAAASRTSKRKATTKAKAAETAQEPEQPSDAEQMEVDEVKMEEEDGDSEPGVATPDRTSDDETEDEDDHGEVPASSAPQAREKAPALSRSSSKDVSKDDIAPPPRRELPFGRPATRSKPVQQQPAPPIEDDDTEDEEL